MTKPITFDGNKQREMTDAEFTQYELDQAEVQAEVQAISDKVAAREALLTRLGITAEEAQLLLGGI